MPLVTSRNRNILAVSHFCQITDSVWGIQGSFQFVYIKVFARLVWNLVPQCSFMWQKCIVYLFISLYAC